MAKNRYPGTFPPAPVTTVLAMGEGDTDFAFLKFLKQEYVLRGCGVILTPKNAFGGGPDNCIKEVTRLMSRSVGSYDKALAFMDTDLPWTSAMKALAKKSNITLIGSTPNIEGLFLTIKGKDVSTWSSDKCKKFFEKNFLHAKDKCDSRKYGKIFTKSEIESARQNIPDLNTLLSIIEKP